MKLRTQLSLFLVLLSASVVSAASITTIGPAVSLQDLIDGTATISAGDKTFTEFAYAFTGDNPMAADVNVIPIAECGPDGMAGTSDDVYGIRFQAAFLDLPGGGASDALLSYKVSAPAPLIVGAALLANTQVSGSGGLVQISETFLPTFSDISLNVFDNGVVQQLSDTVMNTDSATDQWTDPVMMLPIQKDILLLAADDGIAGTVSFVDQLYYQVPEPSSIGLFAIALLGLLIRRK